MAASLRRGWIIIVLAAVFALAQPAYFAVQTLLADELDAARMTAYLAVGFLLVALALTGVPRRRELAALSTRDVLAICAGGVLGVFGTQYVVLANRYTDAPPGSEVVFFTAAGWGAVLVVGSLLTSRRASAIQVVAAFLALAGAATVCANWERPSSFSPFVRYPREDLAMLAAGIGWFVLTIVVVSLSRRHPWRAVLPPIAAAGASVAIVVALAAPTRAVLLGGFISVWPQMLAAICALSAMFVSWSMLARRVGPVRPAALFMLLPVTLSLIAGAGVHCRPRRPEPDALDAGRMGLFGHAGRSRRHRPPAERCHGGSD